MLKRSFVLGNGNMLVGFDMHGQVKDFYYPYVGLENHVHATHKIGFWTNNHFVPLDDEGWAKELHYKENTLVTDIQATHPELPCKITLHDAVHHESDILIRAMTLTNTTDDPQNVRVFFHQKFEIYGTTEANTAYYNPYVTAIIHYKVKRYFLIDGYVANAEKSGFNDYSIGLSGVKGYKGTWEDAQDGTLSKDPIEHGPVDSTISFEVLLEPGQSSQVYYWICVGNTFDQVCRLNDIVYEQSPGKLMNEAEKHWLAWSDRPQFIFQGLPEQVVNQFRRSLLIVRVHADNDGAFIASTDSDTYFHWRDTYNYMWPRDGALIARSIDRAGYYELTERFFKFCKKVLTKKGYLLHKYCPDGSVGSSWHPWIYEGKPQLPIQEDEVGLVLDAFWKHYIQHGNKNAVALAFKSFVRPIATFLSEYIDEQTGLVQQSYDLWEEKLGMHTWTCATVYAGLHAAVHFENEFGDEAQKNIYISVARRLKKAILTYLYDEEKEYFIKSVYYTQGELRRDTTIDASSAYSMFQFKLLSCHDSRIVKSYERYVQECITPIGGFMRYPDDIYYRADAHPSNAWYITTLWLAEYYIAKAKNEAELEPARKIFDWVMQYTPSTGILSEQLNPCNGESLSVAPLTWSHATFIIAVNKYLEKLEVLGICPTCNPPLIYEKPCPLCMEDV